MNHEICAVDDMLGLCVGGLEPRTIGLFASKKKAPRPFRAGGLWAETVEITGRPS
jgi:hypothetical protein